MILIPLITNIIYLYYNLAGLLGLMRFHYGTMLPWGNIEVLSCDVQMPWNHVTTFSAFPLISVWVLPSDSIYQLNGRLILLKDPKIK